MFIKSIDLQNFRNYEELHLDLGEGIHILYGDNAQGKTNILEALYMASVSKSHRQAKDREMIRFGNEEGHIKMISDKKEKEYRIDIHLRAGKNKGIAVNSVPVKKASEFLGIMNCVLFSPEDLQIVKEGPQERRRFIDTELLQLDRIYLDAFTKYRKALEQRNQLLKDISFNYSLIDTLDVWDEQLIFYGKEIIRKRQKFVEEMNGFSGKIHENLSGGKEKLVLKYEPDVFSEELKERLISAREKDLKYKTTTVGPHRDDMSFLLTSSADNNTIDARIYGSQGQQRTCALSLKLAEIELVKEKAGDTPVLLLDDVLSELDGNRQKYLLESIKDIQTIITCTGLDDFVRNRFQVNNVYKVVNGKVIKNEQHE